MPAQPRKARKPAEPIEVLTSQQLPRRCTAHKKLRIYDDDGEWVRTEQGERCKRPPVKGATVCPAHGGAAPQVRLKAEAQLRAARDSLMEMLLTIARDEAVQAKDRLKAITWALERAGFKPGMQVDITLKPWQKMLQRMMGDDREELDISDIDVGEEDEDDV
jgi:hypothetical protein